MQGLGMGRVNACKGWAWVGMQGLGTQHGKGVCMQELGTCRVGIAVIRHHHHPGPHQTCWNTLSPNNLNPTNLNPTNPYPPHTHTTPQPFRLAGARRLRCAVCCGQPGAAGHGAAHLTEAR